MLPGQRSWECKSHCGCERGEERNCSVRLKLFVDGEKGNVGFVVEGSIRQGYCSSYGIVVEDRRILDDALLNFRNLSGCGF